VSSDSVWRDLTEVTSSFTLRSATAEKGGFEYALDLRGAAYPSSEGRDERTMVYEAWVGGRTSGGALSFRAGQIRLFELGALGSFGGATGEYRARSATRAGRFRAGLFGGLEPKNFEAGYVEDVRKGGAWLALDGAANRRHVLGYVRIENAGITERSVLSLTNFIPAGRNAFIYQLAEYDLEGPGGGDGSGLNYVFVNARVLPVQRVELMGNYQRGRSIDARSITDDILNGRPIPPGALQGYLFESLGGRVTVEVVRNVRLHAGYAQDKTNRNDEPSGRISAGLWAGNIGGSGIDFTLSDNRIDGEDQSYDAWYASIGRRFGSRLYASLDYSSSVALVRFVGDGGVIVETRPETERYGISAVWNISRAYSLTLTVEELRDDQATDQRSVLGIAYRF
jgi:hypothetical protein